MQEHMGSGQEEQKIYKIEKIEPVKKSNTAHPTSEIQGIDTEEKIAPSKTKFDAAIVKADESYVQSREDIAVSRKRVRSSEESPLTELALSDKKVQRLEPVNIDKVIDNSKALREQFRRPIEELEGAIEKYPNLKLSPVAESQLSKKLVHIDTTLRSALGVAGVEANALPEVSKEMNPLLKFLNYLTHGDQNLSSLAKEAATLANTKGSISPAKLLAIQVKINFVQQEVEFFTGVLNKALESAKMLMNIQI